MCAQCSLSQLKHLEKDLLISLLHSIVLPKAARAEFTQNDGDFLASDEC
jgi:hypothetical protein